MKFIRFIENFWKLICAWFAFSCLLGLGAGYVLAKDNKTARWIVTMLAQGEFVTSVVDTARWEELPRYYYGYLYVNGVGMRFGRVVGHFDKFGFFIRLRFNADKQEYEEIDGEGRRGELRAWLREYIVAAWFVVVAGGMGFCVSSYRIFRGYRSAFYPHLCKCSSDLEEEHV